MASARSALRNSNWARAGKELERVHPLLSRLGETLPWLAVQVRVELARAHLALNDAATAAELSTEIAGILLARPHLGTLRDDAAGLQRHVDELRDHPAGRAATLTAAELRLLPLLTTHLSFRQIADHLYVSRNTVKTQAISVYRKLGVASRTEAIDRAIEIGLLRPEGELVDKRAVPAPDHPKRAMSRAAGASTVAKRGASRLAVRRPRGGAWADLIAIGYPDETTALRAADEAERLAGELVVRPDAIAAVACNRDGTYKVVTIIIRLREGRRGAASGACSSGCSSSCPSSAWRSAPVSGPCMGKLERSGLDREFQEEVRDLVKPGTSALFLIVEKISPDKAVEALGAFRGRALSSAALQDAEAELAGRAAGPGRGRRLTGGPCRSS